MYENNYSTGKFLAAIAGEHTVQKRELLEMIIAQPNVLVLESSSKTESTFLGQVFKNEKATQRLTTQSHSEHRDFSSCAALQGELMGARRSKSITADHRQEKTTRHKKLLELNYYDDYVRAVELLMLFFF